MNETLKTIHVIGMVIILTKIRHTESTHCKMNETNAKWKELPKIPTTTKLYQTRRTQEVMRYSIWMYEKQM